MKNIVLVGFMGTGKTEVGRELSRLLGMRFIDLDSEIEKSEGMSIKEIFKRFGEKYFRDAESREVERISKVDNVVISTGGGVVLREENMEHLRGNGIIVGLFASPEVIISRVKNSNERPLLNVPEPIERIKGLLDLRMPFYKKADIRIETNGLTPVEVAEKILKETGWKG